MGNGRRTSPLGKFCLAGVNFMRSRGHSLVEFALVFPFLTLLFLAIVDLSLMMIRQMSLEGACSTLARTLSISKLESVAEMNQLARGRLATQFGPDLVATIQIENVPSTPSSQPFRSPRRVRLIKLTIVEPYKPIFPLLQWALGETPLVLKSFAVEPQIAS